MSLISNQVKSDFFPSFLYYISQVKISNIVLIHAFLCTLFAHSVVSTTFPIIGLIFYYLRYSLLIIFVWGMFTNFCIYRHFTFRCDIFVLLILFYLSSAIFSILINSSRIDLMKSLTSLQYTAMPLIASFAYIQTFQKKHIDRVGFVFVIFALLNVIYSFIEISVKMENLTMLHIAAFFSDRNMYARFLVIVTSFLLLRFFSKEKRNIFSLEVFIIFIIFTNITLLFSRSGYLLYLLAVGFIVWQTKSKFIKTYGVIFSVIGILLFSLMIYKRIQSERLHLRSMGDLARLSVLKAGINMIRHSPIYGIGYGAASDKFHDYEDKTIPGLAFVTTIHNIYINVLAEQGIIGFTIYILLNFGLLYQLWKKISIIEDLRDKKNELLCFLSLGIYLIHGIVYHTFDYEGIYWIIIALSIVVLRSEKEDHNAQKDIFFKNA